MPRPSFIPAQIQAAIPDITNVEVAIPIGGQKQVFPCEINDDRYALKLMYTDLTAEQLLDIDTLSDPNQPALNRAHREVRIMHCCDSPYLAKLGPLGICLTEIAGQKVLYYFEEWINGTDLRQIIEQNKCLPIIKVVDLGTHIATAIDVLWSSRIVHRDIKPENIMRRYDNGDFILIDLGVAFDLNDVSLTNDLFVVGTPRYFSPEQAYYRNRSTLDFRSDIFTLGIVLYETSTGQHPFWQPGMRDVEVIDRICNSPVSLSDNLCKKSFVIFFQNYRRSRTWLLGKRY